MNYNTNTYSTTLDGVDKETLQFNYRVIRLIQFGLSTDGVAAETGLTHGQISYRIKMFGLQGERRRCRMGSTPAARQIIKMADKASREQKQNDVEKYQYIRDTVLKVQRENKF